MNKSLEGLNTDVRFHVSGAQATRRLLEVIAVVALSCVLALFVSFAGENSGLAEGIVLFYMPSVAITLVFFGGVHAAPADVYLQVFLIAFTLQNLLVWFVGKWVFGHVRRAARET